MQALRLPRGQRHCGENSLRGRGLRDEGLIVGAGATGDPRGAASQSPGAEPAGTASVGFAADRRGERPLPSLLPKDSRRVLEAVLLPAYTSARRMPGLLDSQGKLVRAALELGAADVPGWSKDEERVAKSALDVRVPRSAVQRLRAAIKDARDPLGDAFCLLRSPEQRRPMGATYTPPLIVSTMVEWAADQGAAARVIDPGTGSGRFIVAAGRRFRRAQLIAVEVDPLAALVARANLATVGFAGRSHVELTDYRSLRVEATRGRSLYIGNPPYVRHHQVSAEWKRWLTTTAKEIGLEASTLAGLHAYFFLATAKYGAADDFGTFITSAEWLDVNYGRLVRELLLDGLGGSAIHVLEPTVTPFEDAATTGAITCFRLGSRPTSIRLRRVRAVDDLGKLDGGRLIGRERLREARRWSPLTRVTPQVPEGYVELGELCRVHRGTVTGNNSVWVTRDGETDLPEQVLFPSVTKARELFKAGSALRNADVLRRVIDLPHDLDVFDASERKVIERFLREAKKVGVPDGYIARNRKTWWSVGLRAPAPILATYMARRPPTFVRNMVDARHINIAHGLYPREKLSKTALDALAKMLRESLTLGHGRVYAVRQ